ncbi:MAG: hypothetical protein OXU20_11385 [Myxococcales bacterium]|nr:hypothetical protein [Myxococcales bacterium]
MGIYPVVEARAQVPAALESARQRDLTDVETREPQLAYLFKHVITQEVAYEQLLFEQRQRLHRAAAEWYEHGKGGPLEPLYPLIAHHWEHAGERERAINALERAGELALSSFANREALEFFCRAAELDTAGDESPALRRGRWARALGDAYARLGMLTESVQSLSDAMALMGYALPRTGLGIVMGLCSQIGRQVWRRYRGLPKPREYNRELTLEVVNTYGELGLAAWYDANPLLMMYTTFKALNLAEEVGPSPEVARLKAALAVMLSSVPMHATADKYAREAIEMAEKFEHGRSTARAHQYYGAFLIGVGRYDEVPVHAAAAMKASESIGNERGVEEAINNEIYVHMARAEYDQVLEKADRMAASARRRQDEQVVFWANIHCAEAYWQLGELAEAQAVLRNMAPEAESDVTVVKRYWALQVHVAIEQQQLEEAFEIATKRLLPLQRPATVVEVRGFTAVAALHLARWEQGITAAGRPAQTACRRLSSAAKLFPMCEASALYYEAACQRLAGRPTKAHGLLLNALSVAHRRGERREAMLICEALVPMSSGHERDRHDLDAKALRAAITQRS